MCSTSWEHIFVLCILNHWTQNTVVFIDHIIQFNNEIKTKLRYLSLKYDYTDHVYTCVGWFTSTQVLNTYFVIYYTDITFLVTSIGTRVLHVLFAYLHTLQAVSYKT